MSTSDDGLDVWVAQQRAEADELRRLRAESSERQGTIDKLMTELHQARLGRMQDDQDEMDALRAEVERLRGMLLAGNAQDRIDELTPEVERLRRATEYNAKWKVRYREALEEIAGPEAAGIYGASGLSDIARNALAEEKDA